MTEVVASPDPPESTRDWVEILATVLLAVAAVATAWSGYQASRWNGEQAKAALPTIKRAATAAETEYTKNAARFLEAALEGRYETFTVGRNIEWEKVKEIYKIGLKHGMKLSSISGVNGVYSDEDLARIRTLAIERRAEMVAASGG